MTAAWLYIDPGSGSYFVQVIIAAILGVLFYIKTVWWRIRSFFGRNKGEERKNKEQGND